MSDHQHDFVPAPPRVEETQFGTYRIPRPGVFLCSICGLQAATGGAVSTPRDAHDASYRPDLPLRSTDENTAAWADSVRREHDAKVER
jgi:hypothetical protein